MSRFVRASLLATSLLGALSLTGCSIDLGTEDWAFDCLFEPLAAGIASGFSQPIEGQEARAQLSGVCSVLDACDASSPLAVGATYYTFAVGMDAEGTVVEGLRVESGAASLASEGACGTVQGALLAEAEGPLVLVADDATGEVDRFPLEVARATQAAVRVSADVIESYPATIILSAELRDDAARLLAPGDLPAWHLADDGLLTLDEDATARGATLVVTASGPGTAEVRLVAGDVEVTQLVELPEVTTP